jgi:aerobic-type carbon monoxide dehydrogenase small subunit (CoxS/CutS family)
METDRVTVSFTLNGEACTALLGDTLMVAILQKTNSLRTSEFGDDKRAGFCLMGACQDCWVRTEDGERLRACTTLVTEGMAIITKPMEKTWPNL